jgi:adenosyl cobinamide kinase/adenosyl cobinamide phosphate guanylyltransferase
MEPLTAGAIATLAFTKAFEKTIEKFTEAALVKMDKLRKKIWDKLRGNIKAETALTATEKGSKADLDTVTAYLRVEMDKDEQFAQEVQTLAKEIHQEINIGKIQGQNVQNVYGGEAYQNNDSKAPIFQGVDNSPININYHNPPT